MAAITLELKDYQQASLDRFQRYLEKAVQFDDAEAAFVMETKLPYRHAPMIADGTPYVCIRIPTGGGKTIVAAHSVGVAAKTFMQVDKPMVLWLVPSTPILEQTLSALNN